jgi:hypothetical protein
MWAGVDATGRRSIPVQNSNLWVVPYYIASTIIGGFLVINIFVGVFVDCYSMMTERATLTRKKKLREKDLPDVFDDPAHHLRREAIRVVTHSRRVLAPRSPFPETAVTVDHV